MIARTTISPGYLALQRICDFFALPYNPRPAPGDPTSVTREEFDTQAAVLAKTREKLERLETRVAELEARFRPSPTTH